MATTDILRERRGVAQQFVKIFSEMCQAGGIRVQILKGFAKDRDYMPGKAASVFGTKRTVHNKPDLPSLLRATRTLQWSQISITLRVVAQMTPCSRAHDELELTAVRANCLRLINASWISIPAPKRRRTIQGGINLLLGSGGTRHLSSLRSIILLRR